MNQKHWFARPRLIVHMAVEGEAQTIICSKQDYGTNAKQEQNSVQTTHDGDKSKSRTMSGPTNYQQAVLWLASVS